MDIQKEDEFRRNRQTTPLGKKLKDIVELAGPSILCSVVKQLKKTVNLIFIGQYGTKEMLSGVGLGNMILAFLGS